MISVLKCLSTWRMMEKTYFSVQYENIKANIQLLSPASLLHSKTKASEKIQTFRNTEYNQVKVDVSAIGVRRGLFRAFPISCIIKIRHFNKQTNWQKIFGNGNWEKCSALPSGHLPFKTISTQTLSYNISQVFKRIFVVILRQDRHGTKAWQFYMT